MVNPNLRAAVIRILYRLDPVPVKKETMAAEIDIGLAEPVTTNEFNEVLNDLRREGIINTGTDIVLGVELIELTFDGRLQAKRILG